MNPVDVIDYNSLDNNAVAIKGVSADLLSQSSEIASSLSSVDSRVLARLGTSYSTETIDEASTRLDTTADFLNEVSTTYKLTDEDLKKELTWEQLVTIYPYFAELSDERKAIMIAAFKYLNMGSGAVFSYATAFKSMYGKQVNPTDVWCANFVGSIISYFWGQGNVVPSSYASVWKIIGLYNGNMGIAFKDDPRYKFVLGEAYSTKAEMGGLAGWDSSVASFNQKYGRNKSVSDWVDKDFLPQSGDLIVFNGKTRMTAEQFYNSNVSTSYPGASNAYTHIGFVLGVREVNGQLFIDTLEGNVNDDVQVRSFRADDPYIYGYGHINYEEFDSTLDINSMNYELQTGIDNSRSGAVLGSVTSKLQGFDLNGTNAVRLGDIAQGKSSSATNGIGTFTSSTPAVNTRGTPSTYSTPTYTSTPSTYSSPSSASTSSTPSGSSTTTGSPVTTSTMPITLAEPSVTTPTISSTGVIVTGNLPENSFTRSIPEVPFGKLSTFGEYETYAEYSIKDYSINDYSDYIKLLQEKGFAFTSDNNFTDGNTILSLNFNDNNELVFKIQPVNTTVEI